MHHHYDDEHDEDELFYQSLKMPRKNCATTDLSEAAGMFRIRLSAYPSTALVLHTSPLFPTLSKHLSP